MEKMFDGLWVHEDDGRFAGLRLRRRTTIVQLTSGGLWVHSPTPLTSSLRSELETVGDVAFLIAPNNFHYAWISDWHEVYPKAQIYGARGIPKKVLKLSSIHVLKARWRSPWAADIDQVVLSGVPLFDECVFLHRETGSLIVSDLIQNHNRMDQRGIGKFVARYMSERQGYRGLCVAPQLRKSRVIENRTAFNECLEAIRAWNVERIIVAHGDIVADRPRVLLNTLLRPESFR